MLARRGLALAVVVALTLASRPPGKADESAPEEPNYGGKSLSQWLAGLKSADSVARREAVSALGSLSPPTKAPVPALHKALMDPDASVRLAAAQSLARLDPTAYREIKRLLITGLRDNDPYVRQKTADALETLGPAARDAAPVLLLALKDAEPSVQRAAATALAAVAPDRAKAAIRVLTEALSEPFRCIGPGPYMTALRSMARTHRKETVSALVRALRKPEVTASAADVLGFIGSAADATVPDLLAVCKASAAEPRLHAAVALAQIDPAQAPVAVKVLTAILQGPDKGLHPAAAWGLGEIGPLARDAVPSLLRAYRDAEDKNNRGDFIEAVGQIGPGARESLPALIALLKDREDGGSGYAMGALHAFGPAARAAVPPLVQILKEGDPYEGLLAARAVSRIDPARAKPGIPALAALLHETMDSLEAADALGAIGPAAKGAIPGLRKAMKQWPPERRLTAVNALVRIDPAEARRNVPALRAALKHRKPEERCYAAAALGLIGPAAQAAVPDLVAALDDPEVRYDAAEALGRIGPAAADAVGPLVRILRHSIAKRDRRKAGKEEGQPTDPAEPSIREALKDPSLADALACVRAVEEATPISAATLLQLLDQRKDPQVRMGRIVCVALGRMGPAASEAVSALKDARKDREADVRLAAACALFRLDASQATDVLPSLRVALGDRDWTVRSAACSALATIGVEAREVAPALVPLLRDPVKYVRRESVTALTQVDPNTATKHGLP